VLRRNQTRRQVPLRYTLSTALYDLDNMLHFAALLLYSVVQQFAGLLEQNVNVRCSYYKMTKKIEMKKKINNEQNEQKIETSTRIFEISSGNFTFISCSNLVCTRL
jgi:hypothetical protein